MVLVEDFLWGAVPQAGVQPASIVEQFDVSRDFLLGYLTGWELFSVDEFDFQGAVRRFGECVVEAYSGSADGMAQPEVCQGGGVVRGGVVAAPDALLFVKRRLGSG